jgi:mono/diheme cytochrome c family protein
MFHAFKIILQPFFSREYKTMKKTIQISLAVLLASILFACGGGSDSTDSNGDNNGDGDGGGGGNNASLAISASNQSALEGETVNFTVQISDPNGTSYSLSYDGSRNAQDPFMNGATFNDMTGEFNWNTEIGDGGTYTVEFTVQNDASPIETDSTTITISVLDAVAFGNELYIDHCQSCHGVNGQCGNQLTVVGAEAVTISEAIFGDSSQNISPVGQMSNLDFLTSSEVDAIAAFLQTLTVTGNCP